MSIIRVEKNKDNPYIILNKTGLNDDNLSFKAKGILIYLLSKSDGWKCKVSDLCNHSVDGRDSIYSGLRELRKNGYLVKKFIKNKKGQIEWEEIIYEMPQQYAKEIYTKQNRKLLKNVNKKKPYTENPYTENPYMENPYTENPYNIINNDNSNYRDSNYQSINQSNNDREINELIDNKTDDKNNVNYELFINELKAKYNLSDEELKICLSKMNGKNIKNPVKFFETVVKNYCKNERGLLKDIQNAEKSISSRPKQRIPGASSEQRQYNPGELEKLLLGR